MAVPSPYSAVKKNLDKIIADPSTPLDVPAIDKLKLEITENTDRTVAASLITQISQILPILREDPTPLTTLGIKSTAFLTFSDIQAIDPPVNLVAGIKAPSPPINLLALSLLGKASGSPGDAAVVAGNSDLVVSLVELWLSTSTTEVAQAAFDVLWSLLEVDHTGSLKTESDGNGTQETARGQGLMWRRIFTDKDVYGYLFSTCSLVDAGVPGQLSKREKTVAQGRLMDFVVKAGALRWDAITSSHIPEIESKYQSSNLLHFVACRMVDTGDVLMHMTQLNFFRELLQIDAPGLGIPNRSHSSSPFSSRALDFLMEQNLHQMILDYYLDASKLDSVDAMFLSNPIMAYVSQYAQLYPNHLLQSPRELLERLLTRIYRALSIPSVQWAHGTVPTGDLTVLSSLPRVLLVDASRRALSPLQAVPSNPANKDCLNALARIFHGPPKSENSSSLNVVSGAPTDAQKEAVAARILYFIYLNDHANFWQHIVTAADIVAMQDVALSAIALIKAVITANWKTLSTEEAQNVPADAPFKLPSEDELNRLSSSTSGVLPTSGSWAVLAPPALTTVLPYLFKPPQSYANFVGGGAGDTESAIWRIASAKYDVLVALRDALRGAAVQVEGFADIVRTLEQRVREGPFPPAAQAGSRVDVLGM
ncbi:hypothetical protein VTN77DRAFT_772 [Rasamsonia byssochlamydoides]|uniref:uncharacterized protein n=1 Tax=Rasamsonia byssochlamydoides TaxID=89139 RepID=UPI0037429CBA